MSYRRQQMERELPEASPNLCDFLWRQLGEAGVRIERNDVTLIGRLISAYVKSTPQGKQTMLKLLNAEVAPASALQTYFKAGYMGQEEQKIRPRDLMEFKGWIYKGTNAIRHTAVDIDEREDTTMCDNCGGRYPEDYCIKEIEVFKRTGETKQETWCNHCRVLHEDPRIRQGADPKVCGGCEKTICEFHPKHHIVHTPNVALLPQRAASGSDVPRSDSAPAVPPGWERV